MIRGDIREVSTERVRAAMLDRSIELITAGVPCEGFSMSNRNRNKFLDERSFLFLEFLRFVEAFMPPYIVLENVSALTRSAKGFWAAAISEGMERLGYRVRMRVLDALNYGVPQRRRRVFFVGSLAGWPWQWPLPTHGEGPGLLPVVTVADAIGDLPPLGAGEDAHEYTGPPHSVYAIEIRGECSTLTNHHAPFHPPATVEKIARTSPGEPMYPRFKQRIRLHPNRPSPTLVSGGIRPQFHYGHPTQARGMTIRERARIQSFPDTYYFEGGIVQGRVQTGDAVPPRLAAAIGREISRGLSLGPTEETNDELVTAGIVPLFTEFERAE